MSAATRPGPVADRPGRRAGRGLLRAGAVMLLVVTAAAGWVLYAGAGGTVTRIVRVTVPPVRSAVSAVQQDTQQGAVAAAEASLVRSVTACLPGVGCPTAPYSLATAGGGAWTLGYRVASYTSARATVQTWGLQIATNRLGKTGSTLAWELVDIPVVWTAAGWVQRGAVTENLNGPSPPPDGTPPGQLTQEFAAAIAPFRRFSDAP